MGYWFCANMKVYNDSMLACSRESGCESSRYCDALAGGGVTVNGSNAVGAAVRQCRFVQGQGRPILGHGVNVSSV